MGAYPICVIDNKYLTKKVPQGNGTLCRVTAIKLKKDSSSHRWGNYYGKKVWTVCATDVEWLEVELAPKPKRISDQEDNIVQTEQQIKYLNDALDTFMTNNMRQ